MVDVFGIGPAQFETFLLVFVRVTIILALIPIFSARQIPKLVRFGLALIISFIISKTIPTIAPINGIGGLVVAAFAQAAVALVFGFTASLVFMGIQAAGEIVDLQIGFGSATLVNPLTNQQSTLVSQFEVAFATLLFLVTDSHHLLFEGLSGSFALVPLPYIVVSPTVLPAIAMFFGAAVAIVLKIAAPIGVAIFVTNVSLGLLARIAPHINVFVIGIPLQLSVGLTMLIVTIPLVGYVVPQLFGEIPRQLDTVLRGLSAAH